MWYCPQAQQFIPCPDNQIATAMGLWMTGFCGTLELDILQHWHWYTEATWWTHPLTQYSTSIHTNHHKLICMVCSAYAPAHPATTKRKNSNWEHFRQLPVCTVFHCMFSFKTVALHVFDTSTWTLKQSIIPKNSVHPYEKNKYWRVSSSVVSILAIHPFQILHPFAGKEPGFLRRAFSNKDRAWTKEHVVQLVAFIMIYPPVGTILSPPTTSLKMMFLLWMWDNVSPPDRNREVALSKQSNFSDSLFSTKRIYLSI